MRKLSEQQKKIFDAIVSNPEITIEQLRIVIGTKTTGSVTYALQALARKGYIADRKIKRFVILK